MSNDERRDRPADIETELDAAFIRDVMTFGDHARRLFGMPRLTESEICQLREAFIHGAWTATRMCCDGENPLKVTQAALSMRHKGHGRFAASHEKVTP